MTDLSFDTQTAERELPELVNHFASASADMLGAILDQSLDCIKLIGPTGRLDFMNRNGRCAMEIDDFAAVAGRNWWELWPEEAQPLIREAVEHARNGRNFRFEAFCPTARGAPRWWEVAVSPLKASDGTLRGIVSVSRDVTERVAALELRETAAAEMRHRLQNAYTLAGAIVQASARGSPEREAFAKDILTRLEQLGAAQSLLLEQEGNGELTLGTLVERLTLPFRGHHCAIDFGPLPSVPLGEQEVRVLALAVGELSTNSNKYGALRHGGSIAIAAELKEKTLQLTWRETTSGPSPNVRREPGSGHRLIERALRSCGGRLDIDWRSDGLQAIIALPLS
jgi:PAS domain S-box-containing protein